MNIEDVQRITASNFKTVIFKIWYTVYRIRIMYIRTIRILYNKKDFYNELYIVFQFNLTKVVTFCNVDKS